MKIYIAGRFGMVGRAVELEAKKLGFKILGKSSKDLDLTNRELVFAEIRDTTPDALVIAAARVGGIQANDSYPVTFLSENLQIQTNLMDAAHNFKIPKLIFLGSSCIYPKFSEQPIKESSLLTGLLEPTNEAYAIAKIAGVKLVDAYRKQYGHDWLSLMPTNLYGKFDNFDLENSHVVAGLLRRFNSAVASGSKEISVWGDGSPLREFLNVSDLATAIMFLITKGSTQATINVGSGNEISIKDLATFIAMITNFNGKIEFDTTKPNGTPRKLLDSRYINSLGWEPKVSLETGIRETYKWFLENSVS
ncbi:WcaG Nucleoside-diphosphate-sugar epimerases [actinobacterium SCGC AAA044-D11]